MSEKIKVLYVEDEQDIRENIIEILQDENFEVFGAADGKEAVEIFLDSNPDIVVSDIMMPDVSGYELLKIIRNNENIANNNVPFIFLSALGEKEDVVKGIGLTANDYLTKPVDFDLLIAKIREKYDNSKNIEESHKDNIDGLKNQVSEILPNELSKYIDQIKNISQLLKTEPYGPFPHRKYIEDINKIHMTCTKLKALADNFVSGEAINNQVKSGENVFSPANLANEFTKVVEENLRSQIQFSSNKEFPQIKVNKKLIIDIAQKIINSIFTIDNQANIQISMVEDHLGQLVFIFYPQSNKVNEESLCTLLNKDKINEKIQDTGHVIDTVFKDDGSSILLYIPSYRVVNN